MMGYGYNMMDGWGGFGAAAWFGMALFWLLIIGFFSAAVYLIMKDGADRQPNETALEIIKKRYAKGEIGKEEFDQKCKDLKS